jgi:hypothetical protein
MFLSTIMKRLLNDDYKALVKAGYLDSQLRITDVGRIALDHVSLQKNFAELVVMAKEKITREEIN